MANRYGQKTKAQYILPGSILNYSPLEEQAWEWSKKHIGNGAALQIAVLMKSGKKPGAVGKYRLSKAAEEDLIGIALFGDEHFGIAQSNRYRDQLERQFSALA